jgi:RNA polymerase sigma factor (sigma-70 family)
MDDWQLLQEYATTRSDPPFDALVRRHVDFVYSAALRQVQDRHLAEDVTQGVFVILSQKAAALARQKPGVLAGWLFQVVRHVSANAIRRERRRRRHEARGGTMTPQTTVDRPAEDDPTTADWAAIAPHLDHALAGLGEVDRNALLLRFFGGKSHRDVGHALGVTEEAARKRVDRAVDRLRRLLHRRGVSAPAVAALGTLIHANAVHAAPTGLIAACGSAAAATGGLTKGALLAMATTSKKCAVTTAAVSLLALATVAGVALHQSLRAPAAKAPPAPIVRPVPINAPVLPIAQNPAAPAERRVSGIVTSADGEPLAGADVRLATRERAVRVYNPASPDAGRTTTAADGFFEFDPAPDGPAVVVVQHALGYAQLTREQLAKQEKVALQPWGRVEGVAKIGANPAAGATIDLTRLPDFDDNYSFLTRHDRETRADANGRYVFDRVAPGDVWVSRRTAAPYGHVGAIRHVDVEPGKMVKTTLGGSGRAVVGRLALPPGSDEQIDWHFRGGSAYMSSFQSTGFPQFGFDKPANWNQMTMDEQRAARERWLRTPAGRQHVQRRGGLGFAIEPDGSFRLDDVPPGAYRLNVQISEPVGKRFLEPMAEAERTVSVEPPPGDDTRSDTLLDVGTIVLTPLPRLRVGRPAPPLTLTAVDGSAVKLADLAGKFVLIVPWSEGRRPNAEDLESVRVARERHGGDKGKLIILTVESNGDLAAARRLAKATGLEAAATHTAGKFSQGLLPDLFAGEPRNSILYLRQSSLITLVDPDGNVAAKSLRGDDIEQTIHRAIFER